MGWLDGSQNNIVIDAVLTDTGRQLLARNDGSFSIVKFAMSDDEVDYTLIEKYGRTVGKEKIEKNTPIFEAQTNTDLALKYNCVSISATALTAYPTLTLGSTGGATVSGNTVNLIASSIANASTQVLVTQRPASGQASVTAELAEDLFFVKVNRRFLAVSSVVTTSQPNGVDVYEVVTALGATPTASFSLRTVLANTSTDFTTYGDGSTITTPVRIIGARSGITTELIVRITKT